MVKLVDTLVSGTSGRKSVQVRVLFWAPTKIPFQVNDWGGILFIIIRLYNLNLFY